MAKKILDQKTKHILFSCAIMAFFLGLLLAITGCQTAGVASGPSVQPKYELTLAGSIDGVPFKGVALGSAFVDHQITISSKNDINYFIAKTCHRSEKREDVIDQGWFKNSLSWTYDFTEAPTIEDTGDCPLRICQYSKTVGAPPVQCAVVDFKNVKYQLHGENICNGSAGQTTGKNICHTQAGLVERVRFKEPVGVADPLPPPDGGDTNKKYLIFKQCEGKFIDDKNTLWQYVMPSDECYVVFFQLAKPHARAKLTAIPYDLPLYSGAK